MNTTKDISEVKLVIETDNLETMNDALDKGWTLLFAGVVGDDEYRKAKYSLGWMRDLPAPRPVPSDFES